MGANRKYKDSVLIMWLKEGNNLVDAYNAIQGTDYPLDTKIEINTLDDIMYKDRVNDLSFIIDGKFVILMEHQSTINENMPLRMGMYLFRLYEKMLDSSLIYKRRMMKINAPEFIVLYNGKEKLNRNEIKLSDMFIEKPKDNSIELKVNIVDIKYDRKSDVLNHSKPLKEYSYFVDKVETEKRKRFEFIRSYT